ncbi:MAG: addiction module antidote protein, HigA family [Halothiobacillus sp. 14-56-357]|jgi:addiction module HigA family antidote|uniref:HigA family addiction module antitoxin n=1 Tax=Halothiobacillus sp. 15-55-196 TaxID=1970382 RepID=UPI000BD64BE4|nr:HigA family addiction module antitoxin [Halothiobacillus sp. 15-55-196]OZB35905.1 MAG: addiction module antidote protein, HigA family [Halothiobacillus sp. 15-55-196]OZB56057.1 MAG: addiction module antidote protein, HigA family [Halothiobacillus sp. 14-56-357]OZB78579.1 MAG: addiction module antidote protein, HigA family [Halothiobacillus sp. 13-55-115]
MTMHNPPHPGAFIRQIYLEPHQLSVRALAESLGVAPSTVTRIINGHSAISPEMALRLAKALGRSAESWLAMQHNYDLWQAKQTTDLTRVKAIEFAA